MPAYEIEKKLVVAVTSSALFDLDAADRIYREKGIDAYRAYQRENEAVPLAPGCAFPFVSRLLALNDIDPGTPPIEVILLSKNDSDTGLRVFESIRTQGLPISRAAFLDGDPPYPYIPAFNVSLFLSRNEADVREAVMNGHPAGRVLQSAIDMTEKGNDLRIAFDFDGVLADDASEKTFVDGGLKEFFASEDEHSAEPMNPGPLQRLFIQVGALQKREMEKAAREKGYKPRITTALITARNAPAHKRVVTTLRAWGITVNQTFFLGGMEKKRVLEVFRPHIFFDDQETHLVPSANVVPVVHIPFGIRNRPPVIESQKPATPPPPAGS